jgi:mannose/fructose-specific phosphotransferase system component IIA
MSEDVRGLIISHSSLGEGMAAAVRKITGVGEEALGAVSNDGRGPDALVEEIRERAGDAPLVLFTDLGAGSCAFAARKFSMQRAETGVVSGVNLPLLLDFVFHRHLPLAELVDRLINCGREGITGTCTEEAAHADHASPD